MQNIEKLKSLQLDDLWQIYEQVSAVLVHKIAAEKTKLEDRLRKLQTGIPVGSSPIRRPYPRVLPKYQNPNDAAETWSGRGKQPRWLKAQLRAGKKLDQFLIRRMAAASHRRPR